MKRRFERFIDFLHLNYLGMVIGLFFYCLSLTPSLLPTPALHAGLVAGFSFAFGYTVGVIISWGIRKVVHKEFSRRVKHIAWMSLWIVMPVLIITYGVWTATWQNEIRELIGETTFEGQEIVKIVSIAVLVATILITVGRGIHWTIDLASKFVSRWLPQRVSGAIGVIIVAVILFWLYSGVFSTMFVSFSNKIYKSDNDKTDPGIMQTKSQLRSGGPSSIVPWDSLGRQGQNFIGSGPSLQQLSEFNSQPATEPIRVYVGVKTATDVAERARLAVEELERTKAFDRDVLAVMTATGTGWIEPQTADSLEYMWNGDTAMVTIQYSYLPSWMSFLVNQDQAKAAGQALFDAVYSKWEELPENNRPKLVAYGLSLGAFGGQSAFSGVDDLENRTDGALFVGSPSFSEPWQRFVHRRDEGSPQWQPVFENGETIRFAAEGKDFTHPPSPWLQPRVAYLQHASDPVVWWNTDLILGKPDWLREPRGPDVSPDMQWYPFVTFAQVTVDLFFATTVPSGHGHNYGDMMTAAWAAVTSPPDWTPQKTESLQKIIDTYPID